MAENILSPKPPPLPETPRRPRPYDSPPEYEDGIVGLQNNTFYCYMNACLQCLVPIDELRDYYVTQRYFDVADQGRTRTGNNFDFSDHLNHFYVAVFSSSSRRRSVVRPSLKMLLRQRFDPIQQHDSHEFIVYLLEQL